MIKVVNELIKEIHDTIYNVSSRYLKAEGWDMADIADYFVADVQEVEPGVIRAEIRGELEYEQLSELCSQLDKVIAVKFDRDAYFEPVEPGIAEAYIRTNVEACSDVTASASSQFTMQDVQALIDDYGTKYFEAIPTSGGRELWFSVFDIGSYNIRIEDGKIIMISTDDPYDDVRIFRNLDELRNYLEKQIAICKQEADLNYSVNASSNAKTREVYITHYREFDNGHILHDFKRMTEEQAQEAARQASIKDPTDAYYVHYDDIMNPTGDIVWVNGVAYRGMDVSPRGEEVAVRKGAQPVEVATASTEIKAYTDADSDDALWDVIYDPEFEFRGVQDVGYDNDDNIMVIFDHEISEDMIEPTAEELLAAFGQYGYPVHEWNTNGDNVFILSRGGILSSTEIKAYTFDEFEDGWGEDVEGILTPVFDKTEKLMYEVRNAIRGSYTDCENVEDLADFIRNLADEFESAANEMELL